jgi:hypothetical protein
MTEDVSHADLVGIKEDIAVLKEQVKELKVDAAERKLDFKADMADVKLALANLQRSADIQSGKSIAVKTLLGTGLAGLGAGAVKIIEFFTTHPTPQ